MAKVLSGTWGSGCFCMYTRLTAELRRKLPPAPKGVDPRWVGRSRNRIAMTALARRRRAPGLLAYVDGEVAGWIAVAPRPELARIDASKATPRIDDVAVWVVPCITVRRRFRGRGVAQALLRAAVAYAGSQGAPAVEGYPRASNERVHDDFAFIGTEALFRKAGFRKVRGPLKDVPRGWIPRVTMRVACTSRISSRPRARSGSA